MNQALASWPAKGRSLLQQALSKPTCERTVEESRAYAKWQCGELWRPVDMVWQHDGKEAQQEAAREAVTKNRRT